MRLIGIGGEPATGKTALVSGVMARLGYGVPFKAGLCRGTFFPEDKIHVIGIYDGSVYQGTDRLSMAAQPSVLAWMRAVVSLEDVGDGRTILFEGDRLFNASLVRETGFFHVRRFFLLSSSDEAKALRRQGRADTKDERFLRSRATKYENMIQEFPGLIEVVQNETTENLALLVAKVLVFCREGVASPVP